ncbi:T9SS type A sorting domain-containing protein [Maribacter spongiicola]|uniref:T9SS type A sorting domain-containing protein n=1 Tax=Maribacter spongiicola TaxID=1206753 RepID=UPI00105ECA9D|nr:T9SS type A sorting domain-containing protein [Maribacter spongiicola]
MKRIFLILLFIICSATTLCAQNAESTIKVFPNPATNVINVLGLKNDSNAAISIRDSYGTQIIFHQWDIKRNSLNIPVFNLEKGIYMISIQSEHQNVKAKFIKE